MVVREEGKTQRKEEREGQTRQGKETECQKRQLEKDRSGAASDWQWWWEVDSTSALTHWPIRSY